MECVLLGVILARCGVSGTQRVEDDQGEPEFWDVWVGPSTTDNASIITGKRRIELATALRGNPPREKGDDDGIRWDSVRSRFSAHQTGGRLHGIGDDATRRRPSGRGRRLGALRDAGSSAPKRGVSASGTGAANTELPTIAADKHVGPHDREAQVGLRRLSPDTFGPSVFRRGHLASATPASFTPRATPAAGSCRQQAVR